jgi:hypothetical protein
VTEPSRETTDNNARVACRRRAIEPWRVIEVCINSRYADLLIPGVPSLWI